MIPKKPSPFHNILAKHVSRERNGQPLVKWFTNILWDQLTDTEIDGKVVKKQGWIEINKNEIQKPAEATGETEAEKLRSELDRIGKEIEKGNAASISAKKLALYVSAILDVDDADKMTKAELVELVTAKTEQDG